MAGRKRAEHGARLMRLALGNEEIGVDAGYPLADGVLASGVEWSVLLAAAGGQLASKAVAPLDRLWLLSSVQSHRRRDSMAGWSGPPTRANSGGMTRWQT